MFKKRFGGSVRRNFLSTNATTRKKGRIPPANRSSCPLLAGQKGNRRRPAQLSGNGGDGHVSVGRRGFSFVLEKQAILDNGCKKKRTPPTPRASSEGLDAFASPVKDCGPMAVEIESRGNAEEDWITLPRFRQLLHTQRVCRLPTSRDWRRKHEQPGAGRVRLVAVGNSKSAAGAATVTLPCRRPRSK